MDKEAVKARLSDRVGVPARTTLKVVEWRVGPFGVVLQIDQPNRDPAGYLWLPYPEDGGTVPEIALEYAGEVGRHSGTYAAPGLEKGKPALKLIIRTEAELQDTLTYVEALGTGAPLPAVPADRETMDEGVPVTDRNIHSSPAEVKRRREAIPRAVQREVWQRDGGHCVECGSKEKLCYDHIIPFSRGGSNTIRNLQLLCEPCNLRKGNRI